MTGISEMALLGDAIEPASVIPVVVNGFAFQIVASELLGPDSPAPIGLHDDTHGPVGLWQFDGSLADSSGNGYDLAVDTGTATYADMVPGLRGIRLASLRLGSGTGANLLRITGDITVECLCMFEAAPAGNPLITFTGGQDDSSSALNYLYQIEVLAGRLPRWFSEYNVGQDNTHALTADCLPPRRQAFHLAAVLNNNVVQFYANGRALGPASSALNTPTNGESSQLWVGGNGGTSPTVCQDTVLASLKIIPSALTAAQIRAEFNRTLGQFYGELAT